MGSSRAGQTRTYRHSDLILSVLGFILAAFHEHGDIGNATLVADQKSSLQKILSYLGSKSNSGIYVYIYEPARNGETSTTVGVGIFAVVGEFCFGDFRPWTVLLLLSQCKLIYTCTYLNSDYQYSSQIYFERSFEQPKIHPIEPSSLATLNLPAPDEDGYQT